MITDALLRPRSIAVIGASNDTGKPGGKLLKNLLAGSFGGPVYPVNPREERVQSLTAFPDVTALPEVDLAIIAIPAARCPEAMQTLASEKGTRAFIVLSAGFSEESEAGALIEAELRAIADKHGASLIGPNCIGVLTPHYNGVFTTPIPPLEATGCDLVSGSGATAVFIMEDGISKGLTFSRVFSVGNSAQLGVEEVLEYLDETYDSVAGGNPKLLYIESVRDPAKLLKHARSLVRKGCRVAAVKAGTSAAGSRAASSHTGALAGSDAAVDALFRKAGVVRCYSREELTTVAGIFGLPPLRGDRFAVVTHAGGPAVMLTDTLSHGGLQVPSIEGPAADRLKEQLFPGSSVANPIDFLATGTAEQLRTILESCETEFDLIDAVVVIFGSPGLFPVDAAYQVLHEQIRSGTKPIYPVLPSVVNAEREIKAFNALGNVAFPDEVALGRALARVHATAPPYDDPAPAPGDAPAPALAGVHLAPGYLSPDAVGRILDAVAIPRVQERTADTIDGAIAAAREIGYPLVMKAIGPLHKSDVGGVVVGIGDEARVRQEFARIIAIPETTAILLQPMVTGTELFAGVTAEPGYGHLIVAGLGGIFVEVLRDVQYALAPLGIDEAIALLRSLRGYGVIAGARGQQGVGEEAFAEILVRLSRLVTVLPQIAELDLNPLIATDRGIVAVDARIRIEGDTL